MFASLPSSPHVHRRLVPQEKARGKKKGTREGPWRRRQPEVDLEAARARAHSEELAAERAAREHASLIAEQDRRFKAFEAVVAQR